DRTLDRWAAHGGLAAVGRVAQCEARQFSIAVHSPALSLQAGRGDAVIQSRYLPIEARQLALANDVRQARPGLAVERIGTGRVRLCDPISNRRPRTIGEPGALRDQHVVEPPLAPQC